MPKIKVRYGDLTIDQVSELCKSQQDDCGSCPIGWNCPYVNPLPRNWHVDATLVLQKKSVNKEKLL